MNTLQRRAGTENEKNVDGSEWNSNWCSDSGMFWKSRT